jgi:hypothetical protein
MRDYAVDDYGLLMTKEMMKMVAAKVCEDYTEEDYEDDEFAFNEVLYDDGIVEYIGSFTGEAIVVNDKGEDVWGDSESYDDDFIYYVPTNTVSALFKAAYSGVDEMISEFKEKLGEYLPDDFDYIKYIRHISGTYYG